MSNVNSSTGSDSPDVHQGHSLEWPSTPYSDETRRSLPEPETCCVVALLGDCTVACTYLPPANRPENHLAVRLSRAYPDKSFIVKNFAANGESASDLLRSGRLEDTLFPLPRLDVVFVRYGINDRKRDGVRGCIENLESLCHMIQRRFETVTICIETSIWVDHPEHYLWDRNAALAPLYEAMRAFASTNNYPIVDIYTNMECETRKGNWDLRVRGLPTPEHLIVDNSFDIFYGDDPAFFTNIHPNSRCLSLIAQWETDVLLSTQMK